MLFTRILTKAQAKKPIPLSERAGELVAKHVQGKFPDDFVFINPIAKRGYTTNNLGKIWRKYAGVDITFYEASRHSFCTQIVEGGASEFEAQTLMRHADIRSTLKYVHANVTKFRDIVNRRGKHVRFGVI